jgi:hypothetical protein
MLTILTSEVLLETIPKVRTMDTTIFGLSLCLHDVDTQR